MLRTRWFNQVNKDCPLPEYPRPQMVREDWLCLNGPWEYAVTKQDMDVPSEYDGIITVPFAIESELSGVCRKFMPDEILWYRRTFNVPVSFSGKRCILHFGAVDWKCDVYINDIHVCSHVGGYSPFSVDITNYILPSENCIMVKVVDPTDAGWQNRGKQALESHGFWYTGTSGIWQTVWLEAVPDTYINKIRIIPDLDSASILLEIKTTGNANVFHAAIYCDKNIIFDSDISAIETIPIQNLRTWSPEDPFLYDIIISASDGKTVDSVKSYFGMRKFDIQKDGNVTRLFLNNKPYFQRGLLDQGYYPDGGLTPPTDEAMIYDIEAMKNLGFNMLRKHIKVDLARWYFHCDRLGMLVWQDMVSGGQWIGNLYAGVIPNILGACPRLTPFTVKDNQYRKFSRERKEARDAYETELAEMLDSLYNCVSIYCWVPFNEGWGQFDAKRIADFVKKTDPSRVVDHASGWYDQGAGDVMSMHKYILPIPKIKPDNRAFVVSEFGGYSMILDSHVWNKKKSFGYMMFRTKESLTKAYRKLIENQIIPIIPKYLSAFIYTQVSDVEFEVNGILTYDREVIKISEETIKALNDKMQY